MNFWTIFKLLVLNQMGNFDFNAPGTPPPADPGTPPAVEYKYPESLDKEYHGSPSILKFANDKGEFDYGNLAKSYINLEKHMGKDKMTKPNENFTPEQWKDTFKALGVPEDLNDYKVENNLPEGVKGNEDFLKGFKEKAHLSGMLPKQAQEMLNFFNEQVMTNMDKSDSDTQVYLDEQKSILTKEWGDALDKNLGRASEATKALISDEEYKVIESLGLFQNATFAKLMANVANGMDDDSFDTQVKGSFGLTPAEIETKITSFYDPAHPFMNKMHPQNAHYKAEFNKLMEAKVKFKAQ